MGPLREGDEISGYRIERVLGSGGAGVVYLARHPRLPRYDAIKVLAESHELDDEFRKRFLHEAEVAARLHHPNLVEVLDRGEQHGTLWIANQYIDGSNAGELLRSQGTALSPERAVRIVSEVAQGLDEIHAAGLLHCDVKPNNILVTSAMDGQERALLADFGIARLATNSTTLHAAGPAPMTLAYAAPEQLSAAELDRRCDVYALGCTLFELLTRTVPYTRDSVGAMVYAHLNAPVPCPSQRSQQVPAAFDKVITTALAKDPRDRYETCGALAAAARDALTAAPDHEKRPGRRRRHAIGAAVALGTVVVLGIAAGIWVLSNSRHTPVRPLANPPVDNTTESAEWGPYAFVAETFPRLLPQFPLGSGYEELSACHFFPDQTDPRFEKPSKDSSGLVEVNCGGNMDPVSGIFIDCNLDRSQMTGMNTPIETMEGSASWSRPSGSGHLFWGTSPHIGLQKRGLQVDDNVGVLNIYFDDPGRRFCNISVLGDTDSGAELMTRWWPGAPL
ncbi:serine/threonine protein kinase [Nocardia macrotermitis]|uniref:non-specific serine/threonine protein kinase n=1 Tax=Nocardia macrotermitis TaxID=2585198 RepID=A0A7K0D104_9NOCA|nr:serine/threonine-protein kinase [Nocardia macrotermitis]MQY19403.1 Serine/threonine-protein kinase PknD [Nocardia macrotermitis]